MKDQATLAREHFEAYKHDGPLIVSYRIDDNDYMIIARPGSYSGRRLCTIVPFNEADDKVFEYIESVGRTFTYSELLVRELEVFEGKVQ